MQNVPRIYLDANLAPGAELPLAPDVAHYLGRVMRAENFVVFNAGREFVAEAVAIPDKKGGRVFAKCRILRDTGRPDPSNELTLAFAPIRQPRLEEMAAMAAQLGVARLLPVLSDRTVARHANWVRVGKIVIEASEQSGRNSIPEIAPPVEFSDFIARHRNVVFGDERTAKDGIRAPANPPRAAVVLIGPEGGFSEREFAALDAAGAVGLNLGRTVLRAETAAVAAIARVLQLPPHL
jgi:16S rRNA (uracil1498-N3)-methyltransferase